MPVVFVIGEDWNFRATVRAELREQGVEALGMETVDDGAKVLAGGTVPAAVVLDASARDVRSPAVALLAKRVPVLLVASRTQPAPEWKEAAAVLWRPVRVGDVVARLKQLLEGHAA